MYMHRKIRIINVDCLEYVQDITAGLHTETPIIVPLGVVDHPESDGNDY